MLAHQALRLTMACFSVHTMLCSTAKPHTGKIALFNAKMASSLQQHTCLVAFLLDTLRLFVAAPRGCWPLYGCC